MLHAIEVTQNDAGRTVAGQLNVDFLGLGRCAHADQRRFGDGEQVDRRSPQLELACDDTGVVEQIGDQPPLRRYAAADGRQCLG